MDAIKRTFDALVVAGDAVAFFDTAKADLAERVERLIADSVDVALIGRGIYDLDDRLAALASRGIPADRVLLIVDGRKPAELVNLQCAFVSAHSRDDVLDLLDDQLRRRSERRVPA